MDAFFPIYRDSRIPYVRQLILQDGYAATYWNMRRSGYKRGLTIKIMFVAKMSMDAWL